MALFLGIDGGGSGCRAAVCDAAGRVLGRGAGGPANVWTDPDGAIASILAAAGAAASEAGTPLTSLEAVLGLAGANVPEAAERASARLPFSRSRVESDVFVALKGALGANDGITAALGTGTVYGVQRGGEVRMIGGWGFVLGDQGSGARIGRAVYEAALLAHDGIATMTPLLTAALDAAGGAIGTVAFGQRASPADFARIVRDVLAAAAAGDPAASAVLAEAEAAVVAAIDRLQADGPLPVCFLGGLGPVYAGRLAGRYPGLIRPPLGTALDGALALARGLA
ncbi:MAG: BadF/BadG/BcrA/BcrD ATPase family protein [Amaricoccus sp.]